MLKVLFGVNVLLLSSTFTIPLLHFQLLRSPSLSVHVLVCLCTTRVKVVVKGTSLKNSLRILRFPSRDGRGFKSYWLLVFGAGHVLRGADTDQPACVSTFLRDCCDYRWCLRLGWLFLLLPLQAGCSDSVPRWVHVMKGRRVECNVHFWPLGGAADSRDLYMSWLEILQRHPVANSSPCFSESDTTRFHGEDLSSIVHNILSWVLIFLLLFSHTFTRTRVIYELCFTCLRGSYYSTVTDHLQLGEQVEQLRLWSRLNHLMFLQEKKNPTLWAVSW